jgi:hypothetical protein
VPAGAGGEPFREYQVVLDSKTPELQKPASGDIRHRRRIGHS